MKGKKALLAGAILLAVLFFSLTSAQEGRVQQMTGKVSALTLSSKTIVMEIPLGRDSLTVGGEVTDETEISVDGKTATLNDIKVGDRVTVRWIKEEHGHRLLSIVVKSPK
ncbi:MAG: hypothetical protein HY347_08570 [candidate division NC10 bacterium]|nr:hypothetical protein [candidate division NC10 bacterium]